MKDYGGQNVGIPVTPNLLLTDLEFADDAALPDVNTDKLTERLSHIDTNAQQQAGMSISIPKTKAQHNEKTEAGQNNRK